MNSDRRISRISIMTVSACFYREIRQANVHHCGAATVSLMAWSREVVSCTLAVVAPAESDGSLPITALRAVHTNHQYHSCGNGVPMLVMSRCSSALNSSLLNLPTTSSTRISGRRLGTSKGRLLICQCTCAFTHVPLYGKVLDLAIVVDDQT